MNANKSSVLSVQSFNLRLTADSFKWEQGYEGSEATKAAVWAKGAPVMVANLKRNLEAALTWCCAPNA